MPVALFIACVILLGLLGGLAATAIISSGKKDAEAEKAKLEKTRADGLQTALNDLEKRTGENQQFFDLVRQMLLATNIAERQALLDKLRAVEFSTATTTTSTTSKPSPGTTPSTSPPTTQRSTSTTAPRPPSTTTTTAPPLTTPVTRPPPAPPSTVVCVSVPLTKNTICT